MIDDYDVLVSTPDCFLESPVYSARVELETDITEVLPYVNATVEKGEFIPGIPVLVWKEGARRYALRPREIAVSNIADRDEAGEVVRAVVEKINAIWENRGEIEPSYETFEKPKVLDVLKLLPGTNCRECGVPTCMAYAAKLVEGKKTLGECPSLGAKECEEKLALLREMGCC